MVVFAGWPGATIEETLLQVTERIERKLQETRHLDRVRELHDRGPHHHVRRPQAVDAAERGAGHLVPGAQEHRRHPRHAAAGRRRARASTTTSATPTASSTASPPTGSRTASCATYVEYTRSRLLAVPDVTKIEILGAQDEQIFLEFSTARLAGLGLTYSALLGAAAGAEPRPADRRPADRRGADLPARGRRLRIRGRHQGGQPGGGRPPDSAPGHRRGAARVLGSAAAALPRQRQAGDRARHRDARRRRHPRARRAT